MGIIGVVYFTMAVTYSVGTVLIGMLTDKLVSISFSYFASGDQLAIKMQQMHNYQNGILASKVVEDRLRWQATSIAYFRIRTRTVYAPIIRDDQ